MAYILLSEAKNHLNVDADWVEDDRYINGLIDMAEVAIENHIHDNLADLEVDGKIPKPLEHALKILVSNFYENREPVAMGISVVEAPYSFKYLLDPYVNRTIQ